MDALTQRLDALERKTRRLTVLAALSVALAAALAVLQLRPRPSATSLELSEGDAHVKLTPTGLWFKNRLSDVTLHLDEFGSGRLSMGTQVSLLAHHGDVAQGQLSRGLG